METATAKLRNQLTPIYSLTKMMLFLKEKPELETVTINSAKQALENSKNIKQLLEQIESEIETSKNHIKDLIGVVDGIDNPCATSFGIRNRAVKFLNTDK